MYGCWVLSKRNEIASRPREQGEEMGFELEGFDELKDALGSATEGDLKIAREIKLSENKGAAYHPTGSSFTMPDGKRIVISKTIRALADMWEQG